MSATAPKPLFGSSGSSSASSSVRSPEKTSSSTWENSKAGSLFAEDGANILEIPKQSDCSFPVASSYEVELWEQVNRFLSMTSFAKKIHIEASTYIPTDLEIIIQNSADKYQEKLSNANLFIEQNADIQKRLVGLFGVHDDLDRQKRESKRAIEEQTSKQSSTIFVSKEPLDAESEMNRRRIVSKCREVQSLLGIVENRLSLNKEIFSFAAENRDTIRAFHYFNQWSNGQTIGRPQSTKTATNALFKSLTSGYDRVRAFESFVKFLSEKSTTLLDEYTFNTQSRKAKHAKNKVRAGVSPRASASPFWTSDLSSPLSKKRMPSKAGFSLLERQTVLRKMSDILSNDVKHCAKKFYIRQHMVTQPLLSCKVSIPDWRSKGRNELFLSSKGQANSIVPAYSTPPVVKSLFSSPLTGTKTRSEWGNTSERDSSLLQVNVPKNLQKINTSDAAKAALGKFQTCQFICF